MKDWFKVIETGAISLVDILLIFKYILERLFGNWVTRSRNVGKAMDALYDKTVFRVIQRRFKIGNINSFLDDVLDQQDKLNLNHNELNFLALVRLVVSRSYRRFSHKAIHRSHIRVL